MGSVQDIVRAFTGKSTVFGKVEHLSNQQITDELNLRELNDKVARKRRRQVIQSMFDGTYVEAPMEGFESFAAFLPKEE